MNLLIPGLAFSKGVIPLIMVGMYPQLSLNGANPIELLTFKFIANSVIGNWSTQLDWLGWIKVCRICPTDLFALLDAPSVWGWNAVDINNLVPNMWWTSLQNLEVNFESWSETMVLDSHVNEPSPSHIVKRAWEPLLWSSWVSGEPWRLTCIWLPRGSHSL
jgi:hypothetical protein